MGKPFYTKIAAGHTKILRNAIGFAYCGLQTFIAKFVYYEIPKIESVYCFCD